MSQKIKVQDGEVSYSNTDPSQPVELTIYGNANVTNRINVGSINSPEPNVITAGDGTVGSVAALNIVAGQYGSVNLQQSTQDATSQITINNVQWPAGHVEPVSGMFLGVTAVNKLEYLPFIAGSIPNDSLSAASLNSSFAAIQPGQYVLGSTVIYLYIGSGDWRKISAPPLA